jgi:hypothetical protein
VKSSNEVENLSTIVDWSTLVIEPENDGYDKGIPDEKPVNEKAMFSLLGLKTETDQKPDIPIITPDYDLHEVKGADILVDDKAPEEPLIVWDERKPVMDTGTPYPNMVEFRKALKQFAINGEFEFGTKKNEPERFRAFCKGASIIGEPCKWSLTASWQRDAKCVMVINFFALCTFLASFFSHANNLGWLYCYLL